MLICLVVFTASFFLLTIYSILQANAALLPDAAIRYLSFKILDTSFAATLFVTLLGALLVRHQFALGLLPRIIYKSSNFTRNGTGSPALAFKTRRVEIQNAGLGAAVIDKASYILELSDTKKIRFSGDYQYLIKELASVGLVHESDYSLENITAGFALSPKDNCLLFEIKTEHLEKIKRLDMMLHFQSQLGSRYVQKMSLIPHCITMPRNSGQEN